MRLPSTLLTALTLNAISDCALEIEGEQYVNYTYSDSVGQIHTELHETIQHFHGCRDKEWACDKRCRLEFQIGTQYCRSPDPGDNCFGIPIKYKYSRDIEFERFPFELVMLSGYPRCWSLLAPLICSTFYRPCSRHSFLKTVGSDQVQNGTVELWQLLSTSLCELARTTCESLVPADFLSPYLHCESREFRRVNEQSSMKRSLYSSSCPFSSDQLPVLVTKSTCAWPLVSVQSLTVHMDSLPVVDSCFLSCRSPLVSSTLASRFRIVRGLSCLLLSALFIIMVVYLKFWSKFSGSLPLFCMSHAMISVSIYFILWALPMVDYFFVLSDCSADGITRRDANSHSAFEWCSLQSFAFCASMLTGFIWLFALYIYKLCPPPIFFHLFPISSLSMRVRPTLVLTIYGLSTFLSIAAMNTLRENDGVSGVCFSGLVTWWKYIVSLLPVLCSFLFVVCLGCYVHLKKKGLLEAIARSCAVLALNEFQAKERRRRQATVQAITQSDMVETSTVSECKPSHCTSPPADSLSDGKVMRLDVNYDDLLSNDFLQELFDHEFDKHSRSLQSSISHCRSDGVSYWWSVISLMLVGLFLFTAPTVHYSHVSFLSEGYEARSIVDYVSCRTTHAIANRSFEWSSSSNWPSPSLMEAEWCSLPLRKGKARLEATLIVFIMLPSLPFISLFMALVVRLNVCGAKLPAHENYENVEASSLFHEKELKEPNVYEMQAVEKKLESIPGIRIDGAKTMKEPCLREHEVGAPLLITGDARLCERIQQEFVDDGDNSSSASSSNEHHDCIEETTVNVNLLDVVKQLRSDLSFQQSMLVNDGAAWNVCMHFMRQMNEIIQEMTAHTPHGGGLTFALQTLCHELGGILPTVSDRNAQLSRWMQSIQEAWLKLDHIERTSDNRSPHFQSQDFLRQHQLLALNTYLGKSRANCLPSEKAVVIQQYLEEVRVHESGASPTTQSESTHSPKPLRSSFPSDSDRIAVSNHDHEQHAGTIHVQQAIAQNEVAEGSRTQTELHPVSSTCGSGPRQPRDLPDQQPGQFQGAHCIPRISAYAVSYSATPRGFFSRLTVPELRIRVAQIKNICAGDTLFPQELTYMLLATGDVIYGGNCPQDGYLFYPVERMQEIFGTRVPSIDARVGVQMFLSHMRRRALTVIGAVGYHFSLRPNRGTDYSPPVLPPIGLYRSENELVLQRVLGDGDDILPSLRDFLREFNFGRGPINPRCDLKFVSSFRRYLCLVARREGFSEPYDIEEYVSDPLPPAEPVKCVQKRDDNTDPPPPI